MFCMILIVSKVMAFYTCSHVFFSWQYRLHLNKIKMTCHLFSLVSMVTVCLAPCTVHGTSHLMFDNGTEVGTDFTPVPLTELITPASIPQGTSYQWWSHCSQNMLIYFILPPQHGPTVGFTINNTKCNQ